VSFIVRSVDQILKTRFGLPRGLADTTRLSDGTHKVLVLDPAVGTATFLYAVIDLIREEFMARNDAGMWSAYVRDHLLDRIFGFELMMAPYAVAHFKLALQLAGHDLDLPEDQKARWAYDFQAEDRIRVYLTNTLEVLPDIREDLYGPIRFVAQEARSADKVKQDKPIMVVLGNPPYSRFSENNSEYIDDLMDIYKEAVRGERNLQPLNDDYIKFIRFAHHRVQQTGYGIIGFITNHKYLHGLIHKGVREELMNSFDEIYILDLHGNSNIGENSHNDIVDQNVFDIKQGVAITLLLKLGNNHTDKRIYYSELWGLRDEKYGILQSNDFSSISWEALAPHSPNFFFVPRNLSWFEEYTGNLQISLIFKDSSSGVKTHRDGFVVAVDQNEITSRIEDLKNHHINTDQIRNQYHLNDSNYWSLQTSRDNLPTLRECNELIYDYLYRPFDFRKIFYSGLLIDRPRLGTMRHLLQKNLALVINRTTSPTIDFNHVMISNTLVDVRSIPDYGGAPHIFPLYLYPENNSGTLFDSTATSPWPPDPAHGDRVPNLDPAFVAEMAEKLGLAFDPHLAGRAHEITTTFGPEDILAYIYAIFHSPAYRERYAEFLRIDFPRVPLTSDPNLFRRLVALGRALLALHLMEAPGLDAALTNFPAPGDNTVGARGGWPKYTPPEGETGGRVHINREQYFEGVAPEVWVFEIGGYQVLHKWLKDRRGRALSYDDIRHYQRVVVALSETRRLMAEIDAAIPGWPVA